MLLRGPEMEDLDLLRQRLVAAFLAMEPPDCLISLARTCGGGSIGEDVQGFIWSHCIDRGDEKCHVPYLKNFLKKLIKEVESTGGSLLDEFYERYAFYMASLKEDVPGKGNLRVVKCISFLLNHVPGFSDQMQLLVPLQCSVNMLEGDTGCALWPSGIFLSEFILSFPQVFARKSCLEVGSGVGLLGICLQHVKASKVVLTDGDMSSLANLKLNLVMNGISNTDVPLDNTCSVSDAVQCIHLPWESAKESQLQLFMPDIVLGADVIYDPSCLPHLIRVLSILLSRRKSIDCSSDSKAQHPTPPQDHRIQYDNGNDNPAQLQLEAATLEFLSEELGCGPVALIASVIRNIDTFRCFLKLAHEANIAVRDLTQTVRPFDLLPYMQSYSRADVRLFILSQVRE
uniref:FAM86 N-terminal domain-containing protein n=1 Tax=Opuntia streptacantha TaxID=393608 RepID=A0A7C9AGM0_OPUST